jgi:glycosyltransferase involved in cell wall biosynthesis
MHPGTSNDVAIVVIGRNEGERLKRCLRAALAATATVVYVDSGSVDGSARSCAAFYRGARSQ